MDPKRYYKPFLKSNMFKTAYMVIVMTGMLTSATIWANTKMTPKPEPQIIGWLEKAELLPIGLILTAKADTGAKNSSIRAEIIELKQKDGVPFVRFKLMNKKGEEHILERPVLRTAKIKNHSNGFHERPVVKLSICLGTVVKEVEVTLASRMSFNYYLLLGRTFLKDTFAVDVSRKFTIKPQCANVTSP